MLPNIKYAWYTILICMLLLTCRGSKEAVRSGRVVDGAAGGAAAVGVAHAVGAEDGCCYIYMG